MKTKKFLLIVIDLIIVLLLLNGCSPAPTAAPTQAPVQAPTQAPTQELPQMTLTFSGDTCAYSGPKSIPYGKFIINVVVEGQGKAWYGFVLTTLEEGKTLEDLQAWPSTDPPAWLKAQLMGTGPVFGPGATKKEVDLSSNAGFVGDPMYFVCFADGPVRKIGALGPVEVVK